MFFDYCFEWLRVIKADGISFEHLVRHLSELFAMFFSRNLQLEFDCERSTISVFSYYISLNSVVLFFFGGKMMFLRVSFCV